MWITIVMKTEYWIFAVGVICMSFMPCIKGQAELDVDFAESWPAPDPPKHRVYLDTPYGPISGGVWDLGFPNIGVRAFLGVPYAMPPVGTRRFKPPESVRWTKLWKAWRYPPVCVQDPQYLREKIPKFDMNEDCLYLNIFVPNVTLDEYPYYPEDPRYPIMIYFHEGGFNWGSGQLFPAQYLVTRKVIVVTLNYRLGAFGFMSSGDRNSPGNYGLMDQLLAMEFIRDIAWYIRGDPKNITIFGSEAGAASVGFHMLSPKARGRGLFHRVILMDGSDLCEYAFTPYEQKPCHYFHLLADALDCEMPPWPTWRRCGEAWRNYYVVDCLRRRTVRQILNASLAIPPAPGRIGFAWTPTWDGRYGYLPSPPIELRRRGHFERVPMIAGITKYAAAHLAQQYSGLPKDEINMTRTQFKTGIDLLVKDWKIRNVQEVKDYLDYRYTFWPEPRNDTARRENFTDLFTDKYYGQCVDAALKEQARFNLETHNETHVYQYVFQYRSPLDPSPKWQGASVGYDVRFMSGTPFFKNNVWNLTGLIKHQPSYLWIDRNVSEYMMAMFTNFSKTGDPTPRPKVCKIEVKDDCEGFVNGTYWYSYNFANHTYVDIGINVTNLTEYRQEYYGAWSFYIPQLSEYNLGYLSPTPINLEISYYHMTWGLIAVCGFLLIVLIILIWCFCKVRQMKDDAIDKASVGGDLELDRRTLESFAMPI